MSYYAGTENFATDMLQNRSKVSELIEYITWSCSVNQHHLVFCGRKMNKYCDCKGTFVDF